MRFSDMSSCFRPCSLSTVDLHAVVFIARLFVLIQHTECSSRGSVCTFR